MEDIERATGVPRSDIYSILREHHAPPAGIAGAPRESGADGLALLMERLLEVSAERDEARAEIVTLTQQLADAKAEIVRQAGGQ